MRRRPLVHRLLLGLLLCFSLGGAAVRSAEPDLDAPLPTDPNVSIAKLPNGLECWIRAHKTPPNRVGIWMHVGSGSINEEENQRGLAHFLEHLAFDGSANFPPGTLVKYFESIGLTFGHHQNAFTGFDQTTYVLTLPNTQEETARKGLLCMADFAFRLSLFPEQIEKERKVILEECRARKGVQQRVMEKLLPVLLPGSRAAARLPIGKEEVIGSATHERFVDYYGKWYRPDDSMLLIVGDIDAAAMQEMVAEAFRDWPPVQSPAEGADPGIKPYTESRAAVITDPEITKAHVSAVAVRPLEKMITVGDFRRALVDEIGMWIVNRRLGEMIQKGTAPFQEAALSKHPLWNVCTYVEAEAAGQSEQWAAMLGALLAELKRAREHGLLAQELEDAKKALLASAEQDARTEPTRDARAFLSYMNDCVSQRRRPMSEAQGLELLKALIETVSLEEASAAFSRNFQPEARLLLVTMPEKQGLTIPTAEELMAAAKEAEAREVEALAARKRPKSLLEKEPAPGSMVQQEEDPDLRILSVTLSNGVRAHLRSMDFKKGEVLANITLAGGVVQETRGARGLTDVAALAFQQPATMGLSSTDIRDLITGKNVHLSAGVGADSVEIKISGSPEDIEEGFRLAHVLLTEPQVEASALKFWKQQIAQKIQERKTSVEAQLAEEADALLSNNDPRFRFLTLQEVDGLTLEAGQRWLSRVIRSCPLEVAVVGDIERDRALALTLKYLGSVPRRPRLSTSLDKLRAFDQRPGPLTATVQVDTITPRATALVGWRGADWTAVKERRCLQIAAMILTTRLRQEIREKRGLSYSPYCNARPAKAYPGAGLFAAYFDANPPKASEAADVVRSMVEDFAKNGPTEAEMAVARKQFANLIETSQKEPGYWVELLSDLDYHRTQLSDAKEALQKYASYTRDDVLEVLRKYVTEERRIQAIALPKQEHKDLESLMERQRASAIAARWNAQQEGARQRGAARGAKQCSSAIGRQLAALKDVIRSRRASIDP